MINFENNFGNGENARNHFFSLLLVYYITFQKIDELYVVIDSYIWSSIAFNLDKAKYVFWKSCQVLANYFEQTTSPMMQCYLITDGFLIFSSFLVISYLSLVSFYFFQIHS